MKDEIEDKYRKFTKKKEKKIEIKRIRTISEKIMHDKLGLNDEIKNK